VGLATFRRGLLCEVVLLHLLLRFGVGEEGLLDESEECRRECLTFFENFLRGNDASVADSEFVVGLGLREGDSEMRDTVDLLAGGTYKE